MIVIDQGLIKMKVFKPIQVNLILWSIYFLIINEKLLNGAVLNEPTKEAVCRDACGKSSLNFLNELRLDLRFAKALINDSDPTLLIGTKIEELDTILVEHELGLDRTESSFLNSTTRLLNEFRQSGWLEDELPQVLATFTSFLESHLTFMKKKNDLIEHNAYSETRYREAYSNLTTKFNTMETLIEHSRPDRSYAPRSSWEYESNHDLYLREINVKLNNSQTFLDEQLRCGHSIKLDLADAERIKKHITSKRTEDEKATSATHKKLEDSISEAKLGEHRTYDTILHANELINGSALQFSSEHGGKHLEVMMKVAELMSEIGGGAKVNSLLNHTVESLENVKLMASQTEKFISSSIIEELSKGLQAKVNAANLILNRVI